MQRTIIYRSIRQTNLIAYLLVVVMPLLLTGCFSSAPTPDPATSTPEVEAESDVSAASETATQTPISASATPSPTRTVTSTATPTRLPTRTPAATRRATAKTPTAQPTKNRSTGTDSSTADGLQPPLQLDAPQDGMVFSDLFADSEIYLEWTDNRPALGLDEIYLISIQYNFQGQVYTDYAWTQQTRWLLNEHQYLTSLSEDGLFKWSVVLLQQTGTNSDGVPTGNTLSQPSEVRSFVWDVSGEPLPGNSDDFSGDDGASGGGSDSGDDDKNSGGGGNGGGGYP